jgi:hypothetical protein
LSCCSREAHLDFKFLFDSLAEGREKLGLEPLPKLTLMADNANAICNGFRESKCDSGIRGNCWFHVKKECTERASLREES